MKIVLESTLPVLILIGLGAITSVLPGDPSEKTTPFVEQTATFEDTRSVVRTDFPLRELWRWHGRVDANSGQGLAVADSGYLVVASNNVSSGDAVTELIVFDVNTGQVVWEKIFKQTYGFDSLYVDDNCIYVGSLNYIQAFKLEDGSLEWTGAEQPWRRGKFDVYKRQEVVDGYTEKASYTVNAETGETIEITKKPGILIRQGEKEYYEIYGSCCYEIGARNIVTGDIFWQRELERYVQFMPLFSDDMIYFSVGKISGADNRQIMALSVETGKIVWQSPEKYVSNIALTKDMILAIQGDASIVALDAKNGQYIGQMIIDPALTYQYRSYQYKGEYLVAATEKYVVTYYQDSQEAIIFKWQ